MAQVEKTHYSLMKYVGPGRWNSYYYQIIEAVKKTDKSDSILVIGKGDGFVPWLLKEHFHRNVFTFDFDEKLVPDYLGDVRNISQSVDKKFDVVICCEVLEHIPFEDFETSISEVAKITKKYVIFSLPNGYKKINMLLTIWNKRKEFLIRFPGGVYAI